MKNKLYYFCYYGESQLEDKIVSYPSVWSKIDYLIDCLKVEYDVEVVSIAGSINGRFKGFKQSKNDYSLTYLSSRHSNNMFLNKIFVLIRWINILFFALKNVKKNEKVLVYHSIDNLFWLKIYKKLFRRNYYLEIEDVFSMIDKQNTRFYKREYSCFNSSSGCLCINDYVFETLPKVNKKIISYGSYLLPSLFSKNSSTGCVKLVYAGVIENVRKAAFLAVQTMKYLPLNYSLAILGFGSDEDIKKLKSLIENIKVTSGNKNIDYLGSMNGDSYYKFLQSCDIALSTHSYNSENMNSADYTFPSKVLVYLANGLPVVAQNIKCLRECKMKPFISLYDSPSPENVANVILNIQKNEDPRSLIREMDKDFKEDLLSLFKN